MAFYHGSNEPPEEPEGSWREVVTITWVVFRTLALPMAVIFGVIGLFVLIFFLFTVHALAGLGVLVAIVAAVAGYGLWEWRHPPDASKFTGQ